MNFNVKEFEAFNADSNITEYFENCYITCGKEENGSQFIIKQNLNEEDSATCKTFTFNFTQASSCSRIGNKGYVFNFPDGSCYIITFQNGTDTNKFDSCVQQLKENAKKSKFYDRTDESSAAQYFQFYGYLSQQQNMLQDYIRTSTYERAVLTNTNDFVDKVVLDVGAGSGILSFFSVQAGAARVYAVEASTMASHAETLVNFNYLNDKITVIAGKVEEIDLPEKVDIIISEPMGYMLFNERMLETYLHAKKWLKSGGKMFPTIGDLHIAPFTDEALFIEQTTKASFWLQTHFHNIDLTALHDAALSEYFRQPVVDTFDIRTCTAKSVRHTVNFLEIEENDLHTINIPIEFTILQTATVHGLAFWFDVAFIGSTQTIWLSTSPTEPLTHWYQVRCLLSTPLFVRTDQKLIGKVVLEANSRQSYDVSINITIDGNPDTLSTNKLDLKNPYFRYTGQSTAQPPGFNTTSPTETYWTQLEAAAQNTGAIRQVPDMIAAGQQHTFDINQWDAAAVGGQMHVTNALNNTVNMVNGISLNGYGDVLEVQQQQPISVLNTPHAVPISVANSNKPRQRITSNVPTSTPTSTCAAQLIGGGIAPNILVNQSVPSVTSAATAHLLIPDGHSYPVNNAEITVDYTSPMDDL